MTILPLALRLVTVEVQITEMPIQTRLSFHFPQTGLVSRYEKFPTGEPTINWSLATRVLSHLYPPPPPQLKFSPDPTGRFDPSLASETRRESCWCQDKLSDGLRIMDIKSPSLSGENLPSPPSQHVYHLRVKICWDAITMALIKKRALQYQGEFFQYVINSSSYWITLNIDT